MRHYLLLPAIALWLAGAAAGAPAPELLIAGFEQDADAALVTSEQNAPRTLSTEQASEGKRSLKLVLPPGQYPGLQLRPPADWRGHQALRFDLWCERPSRLGIRVDDADSTGYNTRYNDEGGPLRAGWNHVQVPLDRVATAVNLGKIRTVVLFLQNVAETTTLYLDNVRLGPLVEGYDDRPLPGETGAKKEFTYSPEVETPHVKWARPLAGGPIRALIVTGVATGRELIELAQRLDLDYDVVTIERSWDINRWGMGDHYGARGEQGDFRLIYRYLEQALTSEKRYDVIVLPMVHGWNLLTPRTRDAVVRRVQEGTGLVLVHPFIGKDGQDRRLWEISPLVDGPDDFFSGGGYVATPSGAIRSGEWKVAAPHFITRGLPLSLLPFERLGHYAYGPAGEVILSAPEGPIAAVREVGKGRVVAFGYRNADFTAHVEGDGKSEPAYPYHEVLYRLVSRAMQWAARREPATSLEASPAAATVAWDAEAPVLRLALRGAPVRGASVRASFGSVVAWDRRPLVEADLKVPDAAASLEWRLPAGTRLCAGAHEARFILRGPAGVLDQTSAVLTVTPPAEILRLDAPTQPVAEGATFSVSVGLGGTPPPGARVEVSAVDDVGRVLSRRTVEAMSGAVSAALACRGVVRPWLAVEAVLAHEGRVIARRRSGFVAVTRRERQPDDDFHAFMSGVGVAGHPYLRPTYLRRFRDMGAEVGAVFGGDVPNNLGVRGMGVYAYERAEYSARIKQYTQTHDKQFLARVPCLNDPEWRAQLRQRILEGARRAAPFKPFSYYVSDESSVTSYTDAADLCFSPHCLAAFRAWLKEGYGTLERLNAQWGTRFAAWEEVVPETSDEAKARGNFCAWADHRTFMEITFADAFRFIRDCAREVDPQAEIRISGTQATVAHNGCDWYRLTQVIKDTGPYTTGDQWELHRSFMRGGRTGGWTGYGSSGDGVRHTIWKGLLHRVSYMNIFWQYSCLNPDFSLSNSARDMAVAFKELSGGAGLLINRLARDNSGIALHYSLPSIHAAWITGRQANLDGTRHAVIELLDDLGYQYDFVASPQIEAGELKGFHCLILPYSVALSDREVEAIRAFAAGGGRVLRAGPVGEMDEHCGRRGAPVLTDAPSLPEGVAGYSRQRDDAEGLAVREGARRLLAGLAPVAELTAEGKELIHCERVLFGEGPVQVLALLRDDLGGRRVVGADGVEYRESAGGRTPAVQKITVRLPRECWVTDVRAGKALGKTARFTAEIRPAEAKLFSLLPYQVSGVKVSAEGARVRVSVETAGGSAGRHVFHLEVIRPDGKAEPLYARNLVGEQGAAEAEIPFAESDPEGVWTFRVRDVATGKVGDARLRR